MKISGWINLESEKWLFITGWFLCAGAVAFPFSVAATNIALGMALISGMVSGQILKGAKLFWYGHRWLAVSMLFYWGLLALGLAWSNDVDWGLHVLGHQWYWFLVPVVMTTLDTRQWRNRFLAALSLGLAFHLGFCVLQMFGFVTGTTAGGSAIHDSTGHIGHIGFGFVYGIWAGWLLHWGWQQSGLWRWGAWLLSTWAWVMIFLAGGRSGYLIAIAVMAAILWKHLLDGYDWRRLIVAAFLLLAVIALIFFGPGKARVQSTIQSLQAFQRGDIEHAEARWSLWIAAIEVWKSHPVLGVGTGGFPKAAAQVRQQWPELNFATKATDAVVAHPHNMYLFVLARWGFGGVAALVLLLFLWIRTGWQVDWTRLQAGPLITLSGVALAAHGLSSASFEEHFSGVLAALLLGVGLSEIINRPESDHDIAVNSAPIPPAEAPS